MTRLELLHLIQDNHDLLTFNDAVALLAGRIPRVHNSTKVSRAWETFFQVLETDHIK
jgi:hypothetical protein